MKIYIDAMGGDNAPQAIIQGAVNAYNEFNVPIALIGKSEIIKKYLEEYRCNDIEIIDATEEITMDDEPVTAVRKKKGSSMVIGAQKAKEESDCAFISAGSTGALLASALFVTGRIKGVQRPAMCTLLTNGEKNIALIDNGANADCKPEYLVQFAKMGAAYYTASTGKDNPSIGLVNIGTEEIKGNQFYKDAYKLLKEDDSVNFIGNVECNAIYKGNTDVLVCDGFTGNVVLKTIEGSFGFMLGVLKNIFSANIWAKLSGLIIRSKFSAVKNMLDPKSYGGVPFLGVDGLVIKAHGNSDEYAIKNAVKQAIELINNDMVNKMKEKL